MSVGQRPAACEEPLVERDERRPLGDGRADLRGEHALGLRPGLQHIAGAEHLREQAAADRRLAHEQTLDDEQREPVEDPVPRTRVDDRGLDDERPGAHALFLGQPVAELGIELQKRSAADLGGSGLVGGTGHAVGLPEIAGSASPDLRVSGAA